MSEQKTQETLEQGSLPLFGTETKKKEALKEPKLYWLGPDKNLMAKPYGTPRNEITINDKPLKFRQIGKVTVYDGVPSMKIEIVDGDLKGGPYFLRVFPKKKDGSGGGFW